jgi:alpha-D-ribose 1-methylphosphonate 5-triphosphate synthase subunit PhnH
MIAAGFVDPVVSAQTVFRAVLTATSRPGTVWPIGMELSAPAPLSGGAAAVALTLCDRDTSVWLDPPLCATKAVAAWLRFHCGAKVVEQPEAASFAFAADPIALPPFEHFNLGTADYPDRSTTIVLLIETFQSGHDLVLRGPGIRNQQSLRAAPLPNDISERLKFNRSLFPRGVDLLLVTADQIAALPRSVRLHAEEERPCT